MVNFNREGLVLLLKLTKGLFEEEPSKEPEQVTTPEPDSEPMKAYWESDKKNLRDSKQPYVDLFMKDVALARIPDATEEPIKESHYNYEQLSLVYLPEAVKNFNVEGKVLILIFSSYVFF